ncbi:MAG: zinc ribbon domain-containing protein [Kangiellaceae bacterium]|nr:zinc ribbon domain-containing protein [Kangiellaceae bacterium]
MPIYEYRCKECNHRLEKLQKMSDDPLKDCPACEKPELSKLVSASSFKLKGTGWYETDFKGSKKKNESNSASESNKSSSSSSSSTSD